MLKQHVDLRLGDVYYPGLAPGLRLVRPRSPVVRRALLLDAGIAMAAVVDLIRYHAAPRDQSLDAEDDPSFALSSTVAGATSLLRDFVLAGVAVTVWRRLRHAAAPRIAMIAAH